MRWLISILLLIDLPLFATIRETTRIQDILAEITDDTLVVFDIDNTLIEPTTNIGSDQWYYYRVAYYQAEGLSDADAHVKAEKDWNEVQYSIITKTVEPETSSIISMLGCHVMALTARSPDIFDITHNQLMSLGIDFSNRAPYAFDLNLTLAGTSTKYSQGILLQGEGYDKGAVLVNFLKQINKRYSKIIFVDDKLSNARNVDAALTAFGQVNHIEFRYGATDERVRDFLESIAH